MDPDFERLMMQQAQGRGGGARADTTTPDKYVSAHFLYDGAHSIQWRGHSHFITGSSQGKHRVYLCRLLSLIMI